MKILNTKNIKDVKVDDTWKIDQLDVVDSDKLSSLATEKDNELY